MGDIALHTLNIMTQKRLGWLHFLHAETGERKSAPAYAELTDRDAAWGEKSRFALRFRHPAVEGASFDWDELRDAARAQGKQNEARLWKPAGFILKSRPLRDEIATRLVGLAAKSVTGAAPLEDPEKLVRRVRLDEWDAGWSFDLAWDPALGLGSTPKLMTELAATPGFAPDSDADLPAWMAKEVSAFGSPPRKTADSATLSASPRSSPTQSKYSSNKGASTPLSAEELKSPSAQATQATTTISAPAEHAASEKLETAPISTAPEAVASTDTLSAATAPAIAMDSLAPTSAVDEAKTPSQSMSGSETQQATPAPPRPVLPPSRPGFTQRPAPPPQVAAAPLLDAPPVVSLSPKIQAPANRAPDPAPQAFERPAVAAVVSIDHKAASSAGLDELDDMESSSPSRAPQDKPVVRFLTAKFPKASEKGNQWNEPGGVDWSSSLFSCQTYLGGDSFDAAKASWAGKIEREGKKETLFLWKAIDALRAHGHPIEIDGLAWTEDLNIHSSREFALAAWSQNADPLAQSIVAKNRLKSLSAEASTLWSKNGVAATLDGVAWNSIAWTEGLLGETGKPGGYESARSYNAERHLSRSADWKEISHENFDIVAVYQTLSSDTHAQADQLAERMKQAFSLAQQAPAAAQWASGFDGSKAQMNAERPAKAQSSFPRKRF